MSMYRRNMSAFSPCVMSLRGYSDDVKYLEQSMHICFLLHSSTSMTIGIHLVESIVTKWMRHSIGCWINSFAISFLWKRGFIMYSFTSPALPSYFLLDEKDHEWADAIDTINAHLSKILSDIPDTTSVKESMESMTWYAFSFLTRPLAYNSNILSLGRSCLEQESDISSSLLGETLHLSTVHPKSFASLL